jgi:hypothetical protein
MSISSSAPQQQAPAPGVQRAKRFLGVGAVGCVAAVLAACAIPVSSSSPPKPASLSQLKKIVLQPADLPAGSKGLPFQPDPNGSAVDAALAKCAGGRDTDSDESAGAYSDNFVIGHAVIASSAGSYRSQSDVDADVAFYHSPKLPLCLEQMNDLLIPPAGVTIESASIKITPGWAGGPANVAVTGTGTVKVLVKGQQVLYTTFAFITGPLIEAWVSAWSGGAPVPASVIDPLVAKVATRAAKG